MKIWYLQSTIHPFRIRTPSSYERPALITTYEHIYNIQVKNADQLNSSHAGTIEKPGIGASPQVKYWEVVALSHQWTPENIHLRRRTYQNCEFCFRILALSSHSVLPYVCMWTSVTSHLISTFWPRKPHKPNIFWKLMTPTIHWPTYHPSITFPDPPDLISLYPLYSFLMYMGR